MAQCDSQHLGFIASRPSSEGSPLGDALANDNDHIEANAQSEGRSLDAKVEPNIEAGARACAPARQGTHVGVGTPRAGSKRALQTPSPALRRAVLLRDHRRCGVPGCRNARFLDVHHVQLRSEGGRNQLENLLTMCSVHHRAAHRGELLVEGSAASGLRFYHADGRAYGETVDPRAIEAQSKVFGALRTLGFREGEVRAVLARLRAESALRDASTEQWLRAALACLTRPLARE